MPAAPVTVVDGLAFPEGLRWHDGALWFSDLHAHRVHRVAGDGRDTVVAELPDMPSGLGWLPDGTLLVVLMRSCRVVAVGRDALHDHADLSGVAGDYLNDMVTVRTGNAYAGSMTYRGFGAEVMDARRDARRDRVLLIRPDGTARVVADDVIGPNGPAVSADTRTLYVAETRAMRISMFEIGDDGVLADRRLFADLDPLRADGICLDAEGALWCGLGTCFGRVVRGRGVVERVEVSHGKNAVACVLGGVDRRTLYLATSITGRENLERIHSASGTFDDELRSDARGWIEAVPVDVPGVGAP